MSRNEKQKKHIPFFAVFTTVIMLMTPILAQPIQENTITNTFNKNQEGGDLSRLGSLLVIATALAGSIPTSDSQGEMDLNNLFNNINSLSDTLKNNPRASILLNILASYLEITELTTNYSQPTDDLEKTSIVLELAIRIGGKTETDQLQKLITSYYNTEITSINQELQTILGRFFSGDQAYLPGQNPVGAGDNVAGYMDSTTQWYADPDPDNPDNDGDHIDDFFEWTYGLNPDDPDSDGDGVDDNVEIDLGSDPTDPDSFPSEQELEEYEQTEGDSIVIITDEDGNTIVLTSAEYALLESLSSNDCPADNLLELFFGYYVAIMIINGCSDEEIEMYCHIVSIIPGVNFEDVITTAVWLVSSAMANILYVILLILGLVDYS